MAPSGGLSIAFPASGATIDAHGTASGAGGVGAKAWRLGVVLIALVAAIVLLRSRSGERGAPTATGAPIMAVPPDSEFSGIVEVERRVGDYLLRVIHDTTSDERVFDLKLRGRRAWAVRAATIRLLRIGRDITGDGVPDVVVEQFSGGMHCCTQSTVLSLGSAVHDYGTINGADGEVEFEDAPRIESEKAADTVKSSQGTIFIEQLYIEYHPKLSWDIRLGRFLTPAGVWSIYHYPPYVPTQTSPIIYKVIFPKVSDGIQFKGSFTLRDSSIDTHLYVANGSGNPGALDRNEGKGIGARVNADLLTGLSAGLSYFGERDNEGTLKMSYGAHVLCNGSALRLQAEYQIRSNETDAASGFDDSGWYAQAEYDIGKWTLAARYDWYDPSSESPDDLWTRATAAVNYRFAHNVVGKIEVNRNWFDGLPTEDYSQAILGVAVAIGDL